MCRYDANEIGIEAAAKVAAVGTLALGLLGLGLLLSSP
jgi:hypothetical protein